MKYFIKHNINILEEEFTLLSPFEKKERANINSSRNLILLDTGMNFSQKKIISEM